jgi:hypothetical protein
MRVIAVGAFGLVCMAMVISVFFSCNEPKAQAEAEAEAEELAPVVEFLRDSKYIIDQRVGLCFLASKQPGTNNVEYTWVPCEGARKAEYATISHLTVPARKVRCKPCKKETCRATRVIKIPSGLNRWKMKKPFVWIPPCKSPVECYKRKLEIEREVKLAWEAAKGQLEVRLDSNPNGHPEMDRGSTGKRSNPPDRSARHVRPRQLPRVRDAGGER